MVAQNIEALGGTAGGGFAVHTYSFDAQTIEGERTLTNVVAVRPGSTSATPIVIVAHRDAARGPAKAELSATAALLELARVFASRDTQRTIVLASTSGGSGGDAGVGELRGELPARLDAAIVLGDLGGTVVRRPMVVPYSDGEGSAPLVLARTVRGRDQRPGRDRTGRPERARPAGAPDGPDHRRRTGGARPRRGAGGAGPGVRRTGPVAQRARQRRTARNDGPQRAERGGCPRYAPPT